MKSLLKKEQRLFRGCLERLISFAHISAPQCQPSDTSSVHQLELVVASVTGDDEDNLVVSLLAKQEFGVPRVIARVNNPNNYWMFNDMWGVDVSVSTPHLITSLVQEAVAVGNLVRLMQLKGGKAELVEVTLANDSPACNKSLGEIHFPRSASVVAIVRDSRVLIPEPAMVLRAGDEVMALITEDAEAAVQQALIG